MNDPDALFKSIKLMAGVGSVSRYRDSISLYLDVPRITGIPCADAAFGGYVRAATIVVVWQIEARKYTLKVLGGLEALRRPEYATDDGDVVVWVFTKLAELHEEAEAMRAMNYTPPQRVEIR